MTEAQIQDIYSRLDSLTSEVNSLNFLLSSDRNGGSKL